MARIVLGVSGGIAAYKACSLLRLLTESGHDVTVVPTASALQFVGAPTWEALSGKPVDIDFTQATLADILRANQRRVTIDEIQRKVSDHYRIRQAEMSSARRAREVARPRQVAMYLAKQLTPRSLPEIGRRFGGRDHTTVIHAVKQIEKLRQTDAELDADVRLLIRQLEG